MVSDGSNWLGYLNKYPSTDPNGVILSGSAPTFQTDGSALVDNDLWIDTTELEEYPKGNERILFIDDEEMIAEMGGTMLKRLGYEVTVKSSSKDALETFKSNPEAFDLVITDQTMPNMSGSELSAALLNVRPDIPIILCTGYSKKISMDETKELGIKDLLLKPINKVKLATTIRTVLDEELKA